MHRCPKRSTKAGITLIEMLASLAIFSLIGVAGFSLLDQSLRARETAETRLERLGQIERAIFLIKQDFLGTSGAISEPAEDGEGTFLVLQPSGTFYRLVGGTLYRGEAASGIAQAIIDPVISFDIRALPTGQSITSLTEGAALEVWNGSTGIQALLDIDGVGMIEIVSPVVKAFPERDAGPLGP